MSFDSNWDVNKYREEHESEDQWLLRKAFLERWKDQYPEQRLVCLARVFTNMEFMGCRYPYEVMQEVANLSVDIAKTYRNNRKSKLKRTFVSASKAAAERASGVKRDCRKVVDTPQGKPATIAFVPQGQQTADSAESNGSANHESDENHDAEWLLKRMNASKPPMIDSELNKPLRNGVSVTQPAQQQNASVVNTVNKFINDKNVDLNIETQISSNPLSDAEPASKPTEPVANSLENNEKQSNNNVKINNSVSCNNYIKELMQMECLDPRDFEERMLSTEYGQFVLVMRPWSDIINNIRSSAAVCKVPSSQEYKNGAFTITLNRRVLASVKGRHRILARADAGRIAWEKLRQNTVVLMYKDKWLPENGSRISVGDIGQRKPEVGEPIEQTVALKMMKVMGWKGGGLGADSQGISEPIQPNLRMVRRAGLGHGSADAAQLRRAGFALMRRRGDALDSDLVFASDFAPEERAVLHHCANQCGLTSKSFGKGSERFLVVGTGLGGIPLVRAVLARGGETAKYKVYIPAGLRTQPNTT